MVQLVGELSTWFETIRAIVFCPEDGAIVRGEPERRRKIHGSCSLQCPSSSFVCGHGVSENLGHKRALLQQVHIDTQQLDAFDEVGENRCTGRSKKDECCFQSCEKHFQTCMATLRFMMWSTCRLWHPSIQYTEESTVADIESVLVDAIAEKRPREIERRQVLVGPHRDDLALKLMDMPPETSLLKVKREALYLV